MARFTALGSFSLAIAAVVLFCPAVAETRLALVIGNGAYPSGPLSSPEKDGQAVAAKLKGLGFAVTERIDLKHDELLGAIRGFGEQLAQQPGAVGLFYYSGHGMSVNSRNYIIPVDANIHSEEDVEVSAVPLDNVLMRMTNAKDKANIIILDACRDNPFAKRWKSSGGGLAPINDEPTGTLIAYAAAPGHVAEAGLQGSLSRYTDALVTLIDRPIDLIGMFRQVQNAVYLSTQGNQQPYLEMSPGLPLFFLNMRSTPNILGRLGDFGLEVQSMVPGLVVVTNNNDYSFQITENMSNLNTIEDLAEVSQLLAALPDRVYELQLSLTGTKIDNLEPLADVPIAREMLLLNKNVPQTAIDSFNRRRAEKGLPPARIILLP